MSLKKEVKLNNVPELEGQVVDCKGGSAYGVHNGLGGDLGGLDDWFYSNESLRYKYESSKCYYCLNFRRQILPKRCEYGYIKMYNSFYKYIKSVRTRVSIRDIEKVVNCFVKNVSRSVFYKSEVIKISTRKYAWSQSKNKFKVSNKLTLELIEMLVEEGLITFHKGLYGGGKSPNILSMLHISKDLVKQYIGKQPALMEDCLKVDRGSYVQIREKVKNVYKSRLPVKGEIMKVKELEKDLTIFNDMVSKSEITINGDIIQDLYYRAMFNDDLYHGGRLCDQGQIQSKSKSERSTIRIDGSNTSILDLKSLHPSFLFELEGISLYGRDPYSCDISIPVDYEDVYDWVAEYNLFNVYPTKSDYSPKRNLAKVALLCMINAKSESSAISATCKAIRDDWRRVDPKTRRFVGLCKNVPVKALIQELKENNHEIEKYFFKGYGTKCMNMESKIILHCINSFILEGKILLPMHDAIIVKEKDEDFGVEVLFEGYDMVMKSQLNCRVEKE